ncbi:arylamine N-acetyltransferase family protein [Alicyclobacillus sp. ALC3]|uniref:arylamine N-acetyltransferase family protein n=1 Tax=Alicyclobacillus sp. ALC3 TaxID=2796143 RepID=UPI0023791F14|nr:arylamine N-acetyltransferase [Alicyclobacillus sp. ALC3]WDL97271.1 arylamine N-acetyltransferase [Alicyclobacillus sp. ALC3]
MQNGVEGNEMNVKRYLERIGIVDTMAVDYDSLRLIQLRHMLSVPFENLHITSRIPIKLDLESLYNKIVESRRGGYCYELNGLLAWLLMRIGYQVSMLSGQVLRDDGSYGPEFDHMVLMVHIDKDYIVDVGFGDSVRSPLPLTGDIVTDVSGSYRILHEPDSEVLFFQKWINGDWISEFRFTLMPRHIEEFDHMNTYQQTSPASHFTNNLIVTIATLRGRTSISGDSFIETLGSDKKKRPIRSTDERNSLLERCFGIIVR